MTDTIKPPWAISIWANNNILYLELSDATGKGKQTHQLRLPLNVYGLSQTVDILRERQEDSRFSTRGDPTQAQTEKALQELAKGYSGPIKRTRLSLTEDMREAARAALRKVGII